MISRQQKKSFKKSSTKTSLKLKTHNAPRQEESQIDIFPLFDLSQAILRKKYIYRQLRTQFSVNIKKLIQNKNKAMTELRLNSSQKQYMLKLYSNPIAILKLRSNSESRILSKGNLSGHIVTQDKIDKVLQQYNKGKINLFAKLNKIQHCDRYLKTQTKILSTDYDDSDFCLKTLVTKIENMIQNSTHYGQSSNMLDQIKNVSLRSQSDLPFDGSKIKISQISHEKVQFEQSTQRYDSKQEYQDKRMMKNQKRDLICLNEYGSTQPVISVKPAIINQYGMLRYPQQQNKLKQRKAFKKKKNEDTSNSTKKQSKSLSSNKSKKGTSVSAGKKVKNMDKSTKRKEEVYNMKKSKRKDINRMKSPK